MFNMHNHTTHSHDGRNTVFEMCEAAVEKKLKGIAFTDHADLAMYEERDIYKQISDCKNEVLAAREIYGDKIKILFGAEMGEEIFAMYNGVSLRKLGGFDVIVESCHALPSLGKNADPAHSDMTDWTESKIRSVISEYFDILLTTARETDYDILAHLTYPIRYVNGFYKKGYDISFHDAAIFEVLKTVARRGRALEINTSVYKKCGFLLPDDKYISKFKEFGGKYVTIGSDAHCVQNVDNGLADGIKALKDCGFGEYYYYENREPIIAEKF